MIRRMNWTLRIAHDQKDCRSHQIPIYLQTAAGGTLPSAFGIGNRFPIAVMDRSSRCSGVVQSHLDKELMSIDAAKLLQSV